MWKIKRFLRKLQQLPKWVRQYLKNEDYDTWYIYDILEFKLKLQLEYYEKYTPVHYEGEENDIKYLKLAIKLIDKLNY